ncbi:MAG: hypothetical protein QOJ14_1355 [Thermoleophilaceae bacterium]|nr:hypothetical protein [Thermoleophilaceae bacterium]
MTEPAVSLAFFDPEREVHGTLRSGVAALFEGDRARTLEAVPEIARDGESWTASCGDDLELRFEPCTPALDLGGTTAWVCRVSGRAAGGEVACLGTAGETTVPPAWAELDALRTVAAVFDEENAVLAVARRPRGALGHGQELVTAHLVSGGEAVTVEKARLSTVYDGEGRQRTAGLELWLPGEDFPRRASGAVRAGLSLTLETLRVNLAIFAWRMEGRDGLGAYEITGREDPAEAA